MARCPGAAGVAERWTARALAGAVLDVALVWACLWVAAAARVLALLGAPLPCTCARPHLPCLLAFLSRYPSRALASLSSALLSRFPFSSGNNEQEESGPVDGAEEVDEHPVDDGDLRREVVEEERDARAALQRELEKERSAAASAAEEAMAMILRLQKEKSALEIEARQQRRTADERCAFYEDEVEELRDIVLVRERESRALQKEVDAYRRLLGLAAEEEDDDDEDDMLTPHSTMLEGEPSSSRSVYKDSRNGAMPQLGQLGNDYGFSLKTPFSPQELLSPINVGHIKGVNEDKLSAGTSEKIPMVGLKPEVDSSEDDGTETVEILPLSARSLVQAGNVEVIATVGTKAPEQLPGEFREVECGGVDKIGGDSTGSENDANIYDVHVVDDICFPTEVKGLICRSFSDATMQAEKLQNRVAADDLLGKSLNAIKGAQDKIKLAASERKQSLQLQLLEDIANQLQEIKVAAEAGRQLHLAVETIPKAWQKKLGYQ
uniref:GTD-binding domain-containing protein n=1 Tax=Oryza punctata TaxID=4537 RepID=A0A0E0KNZ2_ORYPU